MAGDTRRWVLVLAALGSLILLAGCVQGELSPEERIEQADEAFQEDLGEDGDINRLEGTFKAQGMDGDFEAAIGSNGVYKFSLTVAEFITVDVYCSEDGTVMKMGDEVTEERSQDEMCDEFNFDEEEPVEREIAELEEHDDGTLTATLRETDENGTETLRTVTIGEDNKVQEMTIEDDEGRVEMTIHYELRRKITMPEPDTRSPLEVSEDSTFEEGTYTWEATEVNGEAPLEEFTVQVHDPDEEDKLLATFDPTDPSQQEEAGFTFQFHDDGDEKLSEGDTFTLEKDDWTLEWAYDVKVYDEWADASLDDAPMATPAPSIVLIGATLAGSALARSRRPA